MTLPGHPVLPGAEPFASDGGPHGALVLHGLTSSPASMRGLAEALAGAGHAVECPLLPGHGTAVADVLDTTFADWSAAAEAALARLRSRLGDGGQVVVVGQSMGGSLAAWLASRDPGIAGIAVVNPLAEPNEPLRDLVAGGVAQGMEQYPGCGSDIADPEARDCSYPVTPLRAVLTLLEALEGFDLGAITCPVLVFTSRQDHVVFPSNSDYLAASVSGPVERVFLEHSFHVATLDYDRDLLRERVVDFAAKVTSSA